MCRRQEHLAFEGEDLLFLCCAQRADERFEDVGTAIIVDERSKFTR